MPLYHTIVTTIASTPAEQLTSVFRRLAKEVNKNGGVFRSLENYGLKELPHRVRSPHVSAGGENRFHHVGRKVGMYFDCGANVLPKVEYILRLNDQILRFATLRLKTKMDKVNAAKRNPWDTKDAAAPVAESK